MAKEKMDDTTAMTYEGVLLMAPFTFKKYCIGHNHVPNQGLP